MTAQTSRDSFHAEQSLILSQVEQLKAWFQKYPYNRWTDHELQKHFGWTMNVVWSRRSCLLDKGFIKCVGTRVNVTGHTVKAYQWNRSILGEKRNE